MTKPETWTLWAFVFLALHAIFLLKGVEGGEVFFAPLWISLATSAILRKLGDRIEVTAKIMHEEI